MSISFTINIGGVDFVTDYKTDDTDPDYTYLGYCNPGTAEDGEGWMIIRFTKADGGNTNKNTGRWADGRSWDLGSSNKHKWSQRTTYVYLA